MRGIRERRYLTEKYQQKQVRLSYLFKYDKPYDPNRYIRTEFAKRRRFYDLLCGNYVKHKSWHSEKWMLNQNGNEHTMTRWELGRYRNHSWNDCGQPKCSGCSNPRRGYTWEPERLTRQELKAKLHLKEEVNFYKEKYHETFEDHSAK